MSNASPAAPVFACPRLWMNSQLLEKAKQRIRWAELASRKEGLRRLVASLLVLGGVLSFGASPAHAQCGNLGSPSTTWSAGINGNWSTGADWSNGIPNSSTNACIIDTTSTVTLDFAGSPASVLDLQIARAPMRATRNVLILDGGSLTVFGSQIINGGQIMLGLPFGSGVSPSLDLGANTVLQGGGTVTLNRAGALITQLGGIFTLENVDNTIQGVGTINLVGVVNDPGGVVNGNFSGGMLTLSNGPITNAGLLEATNGGILQLQNTTVINTGGNITANGGTVQLLAPSVIVGGNITANNGGAVQLSGAIQGATLNTLNGGVLGTFPFDVVTLDGVTNGPITISGGSTYTAGDVTSTLILGTINNQGNIQLNGGGGASPSLALVANASLQGGGTVTLNGGGGVITQSGGIFTLENVNNTIQGVGNINLVGLVNDPGGVVNANVNSIVQTLLLSNGPITNVGLLEATNGGMLQLQNTTVINTGGNITANGGTVELSNPTVIVGGNITANNGGIVQLDGADIQGATLNTLNGGFWKPLHSP